MYTSLAELLYLILYFEKKNFNFRSFEGATRASVARDLRPITVQPGTWWPRRVLPSRRTPRCRDSGRTRWCVRCAADRCGTLGSGTRSAAASGPCRRTALSGWLCGPSCPGYLTYEKDQKQLILNRKLFSMVRWQNALPDTDWLAYPVSNLSCQAQYPNLFCSTRGLFGILFLDGYRCKIFLAQK